ncbi:unnamed protein product, partial [Arabidopsis halleri]
FYCSFDAEVWFYFTSRAHVSPLHLFDDRVGWLKNPCQDKNVVTIFRLAFQASMFILWKERNARLHNSTSRTLSALIRYREFRD